MPWPYQYSIWPFALTQSDTSTFNGMNLSLTSSGASLSLSGQGSVPQNASIGGIAQLSTGTGAANADAPAAGGTSGWITTNLANLTLNLNFVQAGWAPSGLYGLYALSQGGDGGGSTSHDNSGAPGGAALLSNVTLSNSSFTIVTDSSVGSSAAIWVEQDGGTGGTGYHDMSAGRGGGVQAMTVTLTDTSVSTSGDNIAGVVAKQRGGDGGDAVGYADSNGATGGSGSSLTVTLAQSASGPGNTITTTGNNAIGIFASASGGNASTGGDDGVGVSIDVTPGNGGDGGNSGAAVNQTAVSVTSTGLLSITTSGANSAGIQAATQGGHGGNGGEARGSGVTPSSGGSGGRGDPVTVNLGAGATITTSGATSSAILAQAQGGQGGNAGTVDAVTTFANTMPGGPGGITGLVSMTLTDGVALTTSGASSDGITARSIGGNAGDGANVDAGIGVGNGGNGGTGGNSGGISVSSGAAINTSGATARGILTQATSGAGGAGGYGTGAFGSASGNAGNGGNVGTTTVTNTGAIITRGGYSQGILAQSISGNGGAAGSASGSIFDDKGGQGAAGSAGGTINLSNYGSISTYGESSQAIVAQSIGGDGGTGGPAGGMIVVEGGASGSGGAGGAVNLTLSSSSSTTGLSTSGTLSHAIVAQSIGGGGGIGGNAHGAGLDSVISIGGTAGAGGAGGAVVVGATSLTANTTGSGAIGLLAQSIGGGGGAGGAAYATSASGLLSYSVAVGGGGGNGGAPGDVGVTLSGSTITTGLGQDGSGTPNNQFDAVGVLAQSIGGSGGVGGGASALATSISLPYPTEDGIGGTPTLSIALATGGSGGNGGSADQNAVAASIALSDGSQVVTYGTGSNGAMAQSIGGGGGQGGDSSALAAGIGYGSGYIPGNTLSNMDVNISVAVGGNCATTCTGGNGGGATLTVGNSATALSKIITYGDFSSAGVVQSIGGGGGNAGAGSANANSIGTGSTKSITITSGSNGGTGGDGGAATATVNTDGVIVTQGVSSTGLLVQSIGGGGGVASGGSFNASGLLSWSKSIAGTQVTPTISILPTMNVGRTGGAGGDGGTVVVNHAGELTTEGKNAVGILAQSVGGGGGVGGTAGVAPTATAPTSTSATQAVALAIESVPLPTINISPTLSIGGMGGLGGVGGAVTANLSGSSSITTQGDFAPGLVAQSVGGGGGMGGLAVAGGSANSDLTAFAQLSIYASTTLGFNGSGGTGANGGLVTVNLNGSPKLSTSGSHSIGILAQSVGGGGGIAYDGSDAPSGSVALGLTVSSAGGAGGNGGNVALSATSAAPGVLTTGDGAHAVVLQSVGGGGGLAAVGSTSSTNDWAVNFSLGGKAGAAGNGGSVTADFGQSLTGIWARGTGSAGLIAQSVGGGGGMAAASPGLNATIAQFGSLNFSTSAGTSDGGIVTVSLPQSGSNIYTYGIGGHAIIAQSIGGGGGMFSGYASTGAAPVLTGSYTGTGGGIGSGGNVTVSTTGAVSTAAAGAFGIIAQSIGGGGGLIGNGGSVFAGHTGSDASSTAGTVTVNVDGALWVDGENSIGVFAQSSAPGTAGAVTVNVNGTVAGGTGAQGVGILVDGGNASNQINIGANGWVWAKSGAAIKATGVYGTQKVDVNNQGQIYGDTWLSGGSITGNFQNTNGAPPGELGGTLTNAGMLVAMPGRPNYLDGHLVQTASGHIAPHLDYSNLRSGSYVVTGNAVLDGAIRPNLASAMPNIFLPALTVNGTVTGALTTPDSPLFAYSLRESPGQYDVAITGTHFNRARFGLTAHHSAVLSALEPIFATSNAGLGPLFAQLDASAGSDRAQFSRSLAQLSPRSTMTLFARTAADASRIADASMSCPMFGSAPGGSQAFLTEGACAYFTTRGQRASMRGDADRGRSSMDSAAWQIGGQGELRPGLFLGGSLAYQSDWFSGRDGVSANGSSVQGAVTLKYQTGPLLLTGALFGSFGEYDIKRRIAAPGIATMASADSSLYNAGLRARAAYTFEADNLYLRPYLNLDVVHARNSAFTEEEASGLGLTVSRGTYSSAIVTPALEIGRRDDLAEGLVLRSFISAGVSLRSNDNWRGHGTFSAGNADLGFGLKAPLDRVAARVSAGLQLYQSEWLDMRVQYDGEFGKETTKHGATASLSYRF